MLTCVGPGLFFARPVRLSSFFGAPSSSSRTAEESLNSRIKYQQNTRGCEVTLTARAATERELLHSYANLS